MHEYLLLVISIKTVKYFRQNPKYIVNITVSNMKEESL